MTKRLAATRLNTKFKPTRILPRTVMVLPPYCTSVATRADGTHEWPISPSDMRGGNMPRRWLLVNLSSHLPSRLLAVFALGFLDLPLELLVALHEELDFHVTVDQ